MLSAFLVLATVPLGQKECAHLVVSKLNKRFELVEQAAKCKWNFGIKARNTPRCESLHYLMLKVAREKGYEEKWNNAIIELILTRAERYRKSLYYNWRREGISLFPAPPNLQTVTDLELDRLTEEIIDLVNVKKDLLQSPGMLAEMLVFCNELPSPRKYFIAPILGFLAPGRRPPAKGLKIRCGATEIAKSDNIDSL